MNIPTWAFRPPCALDNLHEGGKGAMVEAVRYRLQIAKSSKVAADRIRIEAGRRASAFGMMRGRGSRPVGDG